MGECGTYVLVIELGERTHLEVGALGALELPARPYAYVGSARGPGGFARIDRHRSVAAGDRDVRHWHVDWLLGTEPSRIDAVARYPDEDRECSLADALPGSVVPGFGASDCGCRGHLVAAPSPGELIDALRDAGGTVESC